MAKCNIPSLYSSLEHCWGKKVLPGIRQRGYYIARRDIVKFPTLAPLAAEATPQTLSTLTGNFTLAADKKWLPIDFIPNKGNLEVEQQGVKPSVTYLNKITLTHASIEEEATAFARMAADDEFVFLIQVRNGKFRVLGRDMFPAEAKVKLATGEGTTGEGGMTIELEATDECPAPFYVGDIVTADGTIKAGTGEVTGVGG